MYCDAVTTAILFLLTIKASLKYSCLESFFRKPYLLNTPCNSLSEHRHHSFLSLISVKAWRH